MALPEAGEDRSALVGGPFALPRPHLRLFARRGASEEGTEDGVSEASSSFPPSSLLRRRRSRSTLTCAHSINQFSAFLAPSGRRRRRVGVVDVRVRSVNAKTAGRNTILRASSHLRGLVTAGSQCVVSQWQWHACRAFG